MVDTKRKNLGRGLSSLLGEDTTAHAEPDRERHSRTVPVEFLHPGRYQPRHRIDDDAIKDLAQSIGEKGILQPILVRRHADEANSFEIIAGERRWRAAQIAKLHEVPVIIKDLSDRETLEIALVENLQRQDLSVLEEAEGYRRLMGEFDHTQEDLGKAVGKSRSHVSNMMRLLALPDPVKELMESGMLSAGHARALLNAKDPIKLARTVAERGLNVRQTEKLVQKKKTKTKAAKVEKSTDTIALERDLSAVLGLKAQIKFNGRSGTLTLNYNSLEQLDDILNRLNQGGRSPAAAPLDADFEDPLDEVISEIEENTQADIPTTDAATEAATVAATDTDADLSANGDDSDWEAAPESATYFDEPSGALLAEHTGEGESAPAVSDADWETAEKPGQHA